jgi:hypothetical protein
MHAYAFICMCVCVNVVNEVRMCRYSSYTLEVVPNEEEEEEKESRVHSLLAGLRLKREAIILKESPPIVGSQPVDVCVCVYVCVCVR